MPGKDGRRFELEIVSPLSSCQAASRATTGALANWGKQAVLEVGRV